MKILIYGAGVLGSLYAARLQEAGNDVSLLARGQRLADLRAHGLVLENALTHEQTTAQVNVVERLAPGDAYDLVIVLMRKNQVAAILPELAANSHTPNVLFMGNNVAGPEEYIRALGRERVLSGFASSGGERRGYVIHYATGLGESRPRATIGETDGGMSLRLNEIARTLEHAGFDVSISSNMDAWLKTHAALVSPIAGALYMAGGDNYRLSRTRDGIVLLVRAFHEGTQVLHALGIPLVPAAARIYELIPEPLMVYGLARLFNTEIAAVMMSAHANAARDEMKQIADEFRQLARTTDVPTPALNRLYGYINPATAPLPEGKSDIPLDWFSLWPVVAAFVGLFLVGFGLIRRHRK